MSIFIAGTTCSSRLAAATLVVTVFASTLAAPAALAETGDDEPDRRSRLDRSIASSRADLADLSGESAAAVLALRRTQGELTNARRALARHAAAVRATQARVIDLNTRLAGAKSAEVRARSEFASLTAATERAETRRDNMARVAYEGGGGERLAAVLDLESTLDLAERWHVVAEVTAAQGGIAHELQTARARAAAAHQRAVEARRSVAQLTLRTQAALARAEQLRAQQAAATTQLTSLAARQRTRQVAVDARKDAEQRRLTALEADSARLAAQLAARAERERAARNGGQRRLDERGQRPGAGGNAGPGRRATGLHRGVNSPVRAPITSGFGMRRHPILGYTRLHAGVDYGASCGAPVYAIAGGEVIRAGGAGGYGNQVVIGHGDGLASSYSHLSRINVSFGTVRRGQLVGRVGTTGLSTGCHLHFEVRRAGRPVDPRRYL